MGFATLVAVTLYVPAVVGAVYRPVFEIVPPLADHVTELLPVPVTVAENCCVPPGATEASVGVIETPMGTGAEVTVTVALADCVASAALVAVTV